MEKLSELMEETNFKLLIEKKRMDNIDVYKKVFVESFEVKEEMVSTLEYQSVETWDSVGHMVLIAALEEKFDIMMEMDDIIDFSGFEKGRELLAKYDVII